MAGNAAKKTAAAAKKTAAAPTKDKATASTTAATDSANTPPTEKQVEQARSGAEDKSNTDSDGYPIGDHLGGTGVQDVAAQRIENVEGHGDAPVTEATTATQSRTALGDNPEADARAENPTPPDSGSVNVAGHKPYAPTAAPLERVPNPVYTPENIDPETQFRADADPVDATAASPKAVRDGARLVDEDGKAVKIGSVFNDSKGPENFRTVKDRVFIEEPLPGSKTHTVRRLLFPKNARVNVADVARLQQQWAD